MVTNSAHDLQLALLLLCTVHSPWLLALHAHTLAVAGVTFKDSKRVEKPTAALTEDEQLIAQVSGLREGVKRKRPEDALDEFGDPTEPPVMYKSLREQLRENKEKLEAEWKEKHNPFKPPPGESLRHDCRLQLLAHCVTLLLAASFQVFDLLTAAIAILL